MDVRAALQALSRDPWAPLDLAELALALALARDEYPDLDVEAYLSELAGMAHEARTYLGGDLEARMTGLCRYLFHEMGFRGNARDYYDPRNSYLNQVLDRRTGLPITLSLVAMAVGGRAGLEVVGVGLPGHFVAKAVAGGREVLFDPFHGGRLLTAEGWFEVCPHRSTVVASTSPRPQASCVKVKLPPLSVTVLPVTCPVNVTVRPATSTPATAPVRVTERCWL